MRRALAAALLLGVAATGTVAGAGTPAVAADPGWHPVKESWQPYPEGDLTLPAAKYCGSFDLTLSAVEQNVKVKVLSRWDDGTPRTEKYTGLLLSRATNTSTGASTVLNLSGTAHTLYRIDGSLQTYTATGPVGVGWAAGNGPELAQGYYRFTGYHVVTYGEDGVKHLTTDRGQEIDVCNLVS
ncbi:hypothetical protein [Luteipulveratus flavus]|uniref:Secreted protein n=1 Tax=Luteipulveratus flavus TaxID=3031728 RepID=A0ABT6C2C5_9MICO|nr:hypothetical protein [Luteipulveratus sp. YIM 133296]MDF8262825.1 hypothetical protein [Luteipulveratus sp. YIM 133296]